MKLKVLVTSGALALGMAANANAAVISCPVSFTTSGTAKVHDGAALDGNVTAASECQYISGADNNNTADEDSVNDAGFFGFNDWDQVGAKVELQDNAGQSGAWAIVNPDWDNFDYMITFKDGADTNLISFRFNESFSLGGWTTPFTNPPFAVGNPKDVSHFAIFRTSDGNSDGVNAPEPATMALFGLGLALAASRLRKRNQ